MNETCKDCKFFGLDNDNYSLGECKKNPPIYHETDGIPDVGIFPLVSKDDWCGSYENSPLKESMDSFKQPHSDMEIE